MVLGRERRASRGLLVVDATSPRVTRGAAREAIDGEFSRPLGGRWGIWEDPCECVSDLPCPQVAHDVVGYGGVVIVSCIDEVEQLLFDNSRGTGAFCDGVDSGEDGSEGGSVIVDVDEGLSTSVGGESVASLISQVRMGDGPANPVDQGACGLVRDEVAREVSVGRVVEVNVGQLDGPVARGVPIRVSA